MYAYLRKVGRFFIELSINWASPSCATAKSAKGQAILAPQDVERGHKRHGGANILTICSVPQYSGSEYQHTLTFTVLDVPNLKSPELQPGDRNIKHKSTEYSPYYQHRTSKILFKGQYSQCQASKIRSVSGSALAGIKRYHHLGSFSSETFFFPIFRHFFRAILQSSIFSCFFPNIGMLTNLIFLLLENFTNSDRTPPYIDT